MGTPGHKFYSKLNKNIHILHAPPCSLRNIITYLTSSSCINYTIFKVGGCDKQTKQYQLEFFRWVGGKGQ